MITHCSRANSSTLKTFAYHVLSGQPFFRNARHDIIFCDPLMHTEIVYNYMGDCLQRDLMSEECVDEWFRTCSKWTQNAGVLLNHVHLIVHKEFATSFFANKPSVGSLTNGDLIIVKRSLPFYLRFNANERTIDDCSWTAHEYEYVYQCLADVVDNVKLSLKNVFEVVDAPTCEVEW